MQEIKGLKCYPAPGEILDKIDIAIFEVSASTVLEILNDEIEKLDPEMYSKMLKTFT